MEWEYKVWKQFETGINPDSEEDLNYLGSADGGGWELVAIHDVPSRHGTDVMWYFKRPKNATANPQ